MSCEELSLKGFINEVKDVSSGPHTRKFCFVLGAGASRTSGIKSGQELVDVWDKELSERNKEEYIKWKDSLDITDENKYSFYSHYYEHRFKRHPSDGYNYLEKLMEHAKPSSGYVILAYLLSNTNNNIVITTNFDHLIEDAVNYYIQNMPLVIGHESLSHYITKNLKRPTIIKIHRDLLFDPANRVAEVETLHSNWKRALDIVFSEYHPIFIGYAGNDNSLMNYLIENCERFAGGELCCPYWMLYNNDRLDKKIQKFLNETNGYYVKHNGFDKVLYLLGAELNYKMPSKEEFISDAEKQFQALSDAIDSFTEKETPLKENISNEQNVEEVEIIQAVQQITDKTDLQRIYRNAILQHNLHNYEEALLEKQKLIELSPNNARYHNSLSVTLHEIKLYNEALKEAKKAVELDPENADYHNSLSITQHEIRRYEEALKEAKKAVELNPENAKFHNCLSVTLHAMKLYNEALKEAKKAVELEPENDEYISNLGATLYRLKYFNEALIELNRSISINNNIDRAYSYRGLTRIMLDLKKGSDNFDEAIDDLNMAITVNSIDARNYRDRAEGYLLINKLNEAEKDLNKAIIIDEIDPDAYYLYSVFYEKNGKSEKAKQYLDKAKSLGYISE